MFGIIYHTLNLQRLGLYAGWRYYWDGVVPDSLVTRCKDEIVQSGYVITKLCQWTLPHLQVVYDVENRSWFKILEGVYEGCYIHPEQFTKDRFWSSFNVPFDTLYEIEDIIASGSIGQVYKIKDKRTGKVFAMKCKHPYVNIQYYFTTFFIRMMTCWLSISKVVQASLFPVELDVFYLSLKEQIYLKNEAKNMEKMYEIYKDNEYILIPRVYRQSDDIIIMDYIEGDSFFDLDITEYKKNKIAMLFFILIRHMLISSNFIHGDLHKGNWKVVLEDEKYKIVLYDMGYCFNLPEGHNVEMFEAIEENNVEKMTNLMNIITTDVYNRGPEQNRRIAEEELSVSISRPCTIKKLLGAVIDVCCTYKYIMKGYFVSALVIVDQTTFLKHQYKICTDTEIHTRELTNAQEIYEHIALKNEFPDIISFCEAYKIFPDMVVYYQKRIDRDTKQRDNIFESCDFRDIIDPTSAIMD